MQKEARDIAEEKIYIIPERFREHKKRMKNRIDCRIETLAAVVGVEPRQFHNYVSGKNPHPVSRDALLKLCEYMNVSPDWLTGKTDNYETMRTIGIHDELRQAGMENAIADYLDNAGMLSDYKPGLIISTDWNTGKVTIDTMTGGADNPYFNYREINGEMLSYPEYQALMEELRLVVGFTVDRFVKNAIAARNRFE